MRASWRLRKPRWPASRDQLSDLKKQKAAEESALNALIEKLEF